MLAITTFSFDLSVPEIFLPRVTGARMVMAPRGTGADGESFAAILDNEDI
jgi:non-ribosomal peptide synthetase component F